MKVVRQCLEEGRYLDTRHALVRKYERNITRLEILQVLKTGFHEKKKDYFDQIHNSWNYSIRGKTVDSRELRIIVSFDNDNILIITAIHLKWGG